MKQDMTDNDIKDNEIKALFTNLKASEPDAGFEQRIINAAMAKSAVKQSYYPRYAAVAAVFLFIFSFSMFGTATQTTMPTAPQEVAAAALDEADIINEDDVYGDLIVAYNF